MERKSINVNGERISYIEDGEENSENLLLIHGNMTSSEVYINMIEKLKNHYHIYAPDLRGFGDSSYNNKIHSVKDIAVDIALFLKKLKIKNIYALGWSLGGGVLMELMALDHDEIIKKAILLSSISPFGIDDSYDDAIYFFNKNLEISEKILRLNPIYNIFVKEEEVKRKTISKIFKETIFNVKMPDEETFNRLVEFAIKQKNVYDIGNILVDFKFEEVIKKPLLLIHGGQDIVINRSEIKKAKKFFGRWADLKIYEDCGHCPIIDKENMLIKDMKEFFEY